MTKVIFFYIQVRSSCLSISIFEFMSVGNMDEDGGDMAPRNLVHHGQSAMSLFPSTLCAAIVPIINLLDDASVAETGSAVYEVAYQVH